MCDYTIFLREKLPGLNRHHIHITITKPHEQQNSAKKLDKAESKIDRQHE